MKYFQFSQLSFKISAVTLGSSPSRQAHSCETSLTERTTCSVCKCLCRLRPLATDGLSTLETRAGCGQHGQLSSALSRRSPLPAVVPRLLLARLAALAAECQLTFLPGAHDAMPDTLDSHRAKTSGCVGPERAVRPWNEVGSAGRNTCHK